MNESTVNPSAAPKDKILKILKWTAFGAVGLYLWRANKVEAKRVGVNNPNNLQISINTEKAIGAAFEVIPPLRKLNPMVKVGIMEFVKGFNKGRSE